MLRRIALSLLMLFSIVTILPLADSTAHGIGGGIHRRHHRHSRRWWRRHRAAQRRQHARAHLSAPLVAQPNVAALTAAALPSASAPQTPGTWTTLPAANGQMRFRANAPGQAAGQATLSVVAMSRPAPEYLTVKEKKQILSGVSFSELRSTVIDKMIKEGGWVSNDYDREVAGRRVFIVVAQTPADSHSPAQAWNFYFTEINGRIYSLTTQAGLQSAERMSAEAERFISSLR